MIATMLADIQPAFTARLLHSPQHKESVDD
jgi:hypothetical protein